MYILQPVNNLDSEILTSARELVVSIVFQLILGVRATSHGAKLKNLRSTISNDHPPIHSRTFDFQNFSFREHFAMSLNSFL